VIYLDTSVIVALCVRERASDHVEAALVSVGDALMISEWTRVEIVGAIGIKVRTRELKEPIARRALADYYEAVEPGLQIVTPSREDYILASDYLQTFASGLRSGDALHLAVAANRQVARLLTIDKRFIEATQRTGLPVQLPW
jgi:predicted nucleic acid-binding protein